LGKLRLRSVSFALNFVLLIAAASLNGAGLKLQQAIPLPNVEGRIDHFAVDEAGQRLFVCALGNNSVEVIDMSRGVRIHSIAGLGSPQGVAYIPDTDRILVANDQGGTCKIYDGKSFQQLAEIKLGDDADNVRYDQAAKKVYVGFGNGGLAIVNSSDGKPAGSIKLSAHPEAFELEKRGNRIFVNVPNSHQVAVVDRDQGKVIATWKTGLAFGNFSMALDEANHRLFVGCRMPARLLVLNTESGEIVGHVDISGDPDDLFYDAKRHHIYVVCGAGKIDTIEQIDPNNYRPLAKIETATGGRTGIFISKLDTLFVAVPHRGSQPAEIRAYHIE
jgi:DNA-binding beta-propeller fold protein YncE